MNTVDGTERQQDHPKTSSRILVLATLLEYQLPWFWKTLHDIFQTIMENLNIYDLQFIISRRGGDVEMQRAFEGANKSGIYWKTVS
ncbi:MAG: hypothetical protein C4K48_02195 [Candidatus Thorarchaeota archaeon]|nr:MAG: hypothetical protein C4K48_02195 [Candidatus Thorarchaeota archaeon]